MEYTLQQLKEMASKLNLDYHPSIGIAKLTERIVEEAKELGTTIEEVAAALDGSQTKCVEIDIKGIEESLVEEPTVEETPTTTHVIEPVSTKDLMADEIARLKSLTFSTASTSTAKRAENQQIRDAKKLIRVIVNCNNKNKSSYTGDIFSAHNAYVSETKFVLFGVPTHITQIMYNTLKEKKCQQFRKQRLPDGRELTKAYTIDEFNIAILPPLSRDELEAIKKKQLAEGFNGE